MLCIKALLNQKKGGYVGKIVKKAGVSKTISLKGQEPCQDVVGLVRAKAQELWEKKGRVQGKDLDIWLEAERAVKANN